MKDIYISTDNLILREITAADVFAIERIRRSINEEPNNINYYDLTNPEDTVKFYRSAIDQQKTFPRRTISLAVAEKSAPHNMIGFVIGETTRLSSRKWKDKHARIDLGYFIDPKFQRRGYATEASRAFLSKIFFENPKFKQCNATVRPDNVLSRQVLEGGLGMIQYGKTMKIMKAGNPPEPRLLLKVSRDEFFKHKNHLGKKKNLEISTKTIQVKGFLQMKER